MKRIGFDLQVIDTPLQFLEVSAPATPFANKLKLYAKDKAGASALYLKDDAGSEREVAPPNVVTGTGTANRLAYWTSPSVITAVGAITAAQVMYADSNGLPVGSSRLVFATTSTTGAVLTLGGGTGTLTNPNTIGLEFVPATGQSGGPIVRFNAYGLGSVNTLQGRHARGVSGTPTASQADDVLQRFSANPYGATGFATGFRTAIDFVQAENATDSAHGSYIKIWTTPTGSTTVAERFRIGPAGQFGIGGAVYGTSGNVFKSGGASAAPTWGTLDFSDITGSVTDAQVPNTITLDNITQITTRAHSSLSGLTSGDDHTQYALLAGRSGGQTIIGGTASGNSLTLQSTSNATRGRVFLGSGGISQYDEVNDRIGISIAPSTKLHIAETLSTAARGLTVDQHSADASGSSLLLRKSRNATPGGHTAILLGDRIAAIQSAGSDGSAYGSSLPFIRVSATENFTSTAMGQQLEFLSQPNGTVTGVLGLSLSQSGDVSLHVATAKIDLSAISAGNPNFKATFTSDTPTTTWSAGVPSTNPAGYIEWLVGATTYYQPLFT